MARFASASWEDDPRKLRLMDWLLTAKTERRPPTKQELADELGVSLRLLQVWQNKPDFRAAWERSANELIGGPERTQAVLDTLYAAATDPANRNHVQAAKLYLEATNSIRPPSMEVTVKKATELSDEELDALLAQGAAEMRRERDGTVISLPGSANAED